MFAPARRQISRTVALRKPTSAKTSPAASKSWRRVSSWLSSFNSTGGFNFMFQTHNSNKCLTSQQKSCSLRLKRKPSMKMHRILILFAIALAAIFVAGCSGNSPDTFQGYVEGEYVYVASPLGGALTNLATTRGSSVTNGQLLFELERQSEAAAVQQAEKNLAQAKANLALSENEFARREKLRADSGVISAEELDQAKSRRDSDAAQV